MRPPTRCAPPGTPRICCSTCSRSPRPAPASRPPRTDIARALTRFLGYCATFGKDVPEVVTLAERIFDWRDEIATAILLGLSNAAEAVNRVTKLVYRTAFGLRNVPNQQRRASYATTRSSRPDWLPATTHPNVQ